MTGENLASPAPVSTHPKPSLLRIALQGIASCSILFLGIAICEQRHLESDLSGNWFFAVASGVLNSIVGFPILMVIGFCLRAAARKLFNRPFRTGFISPFALPIAVGTILMCLAAFPRQSPSVLFQQFLEIDAPPSVTDLRYWWGTLPGDSEFVLRFKLAPSDFSRLLACQKFTKVTDPSQIQHDLQDAMMSDRNRARLAPPDQPISLYYKFEADNPAPPHIVEIFATADQSNVLIYGDN